MPEKGRRGNDLNSIGVKENQDCGREIRSRRVCYSGDLHHVVEQNVTHPPSRRYINLP